METYDPERYIGLLNDIPGSIPADHYSLSQEALLKERAKKPGCLWLSLAVFLSIITLIGLPPTLIFLPLVVLFFWLHFTNKPEHYAIAPSDPQPEKSTL